MEKTKEKKEEKKVEKSSTPKGKKCVGCGWKCDYKRAQYHVVCPHCGSRLKEV